MKQWSDFFVSILGAAATLTGLIFVGVSINLNKILTVPQLPDRAKGSLVLLMNILFVSMFCSIPNQPAFLLGTELLISGTTTWIVSFVLDVHMLKVVKAKLKGSYRMNMAFTQLAVLPTIFAGYFIIKNGAIGMYLLIPAILFSFIKAVTDAWVLLVEVNRNK